MTKPRVLVWEDAAGIIRWNKPHSHIYFKREIARIPTDIEEGFRRHHPLTEELLIVDSFCGREKSFFLESGSTGMLSMLHWRALHTYTYGKR